MDSRTNRKIVLRRRPEGLPELADFGVEEEQAVDPAPGSVLLSRGAAAERVELVARLEGARPLAVEFVVDGEVVATSETLSAHVALGRGDHVLEVRPVDPTLEVVLGTSRFSVR